jgi:hypothetical protein
MAINYGQNLNYEGLGTLTLPTIAAAGNYLIDGKISIPHSQGSGPSQVQAVIKQNGTTKQTGPVGADGFFKELACAAGDVLTVILSSSAAADQGLNVIKTSIALSQTF